MGIFLIGIILLIICVLCGIWDKNSYSEAPIFISASCGILSAIILFITILAGIGCQATKQQGYERVLYEKSVLEYRLKNEINTVGNEMLYNDIVEFNKEIKSTKYWSKNFWTNWYNNDLVEDIDYIEIDGIVPKDFE
jgi:hypothetical protein